LTDKKILSIIIPALNEEENLKNLLPEIQRQHLLYSQNIKTDKTLDISTSIKFSDEDPDRDFERDSERNSAINTKRDSERNSEGNKVKYQSQVYSSGDRYEETEEPFSLEIIVSDGGSRDNTKEVSRINGALTVDSPPGRGKQLMEGLRFSKGSYFLFLHADTKIGNDFMENIMNAFRNNILYGCFTLKMESDKKIYRLGENFSNRRSRNGIVFGDQGIFFSREHLEKYGPFPEIPLMEDYGYTMNLKKKGIYPHILRSELTASVRRFEEQGIVMTALRMYFLRFLFRMGISPHILSSMYRKGVWGFIIKNIRDSKT